jgi:uncharacterized cupin superfamily protein
MSAIPVIPRPRRVVTGHDAQGRSIILSDGPNPVMVQPASSPAFGLAEIWRCDAQPPSNAGNEDGALQPFTLEPVPGGLIARLVHFPPDEELGWSAEDATQAFDEFGGGEAMVNQGKRHAGFHRTQSLDFAIVTEGEIWCLMDVGETLLKPGDILVQRGTSHAWSNRTDKPARVCFFAVTAQPLALPQQAHAQHQQAQHQQAQHQRAEHQPPQPQEAAA